LAVIAKAAVFKEDMLIVLNNTTVALWATVLRVVSEALKEASEATMPTQHLREVKIYLAVLPIYPWLYAGGMSWCVQRPLLELYQAACQLSTLCILALLFTSVMVLWSACSPARAARISLASRTSSHRGTWPAMTSAASSEIVLKALDILTAHRRYVELKPRM